MSGELLPVSFLGVIVGALMKGGVYKSATQAQGDARDILAAINRAALTEAPPPETRHEAFGHPTPILTCPMCIQRIATATLSREGATSE